MIHQMNFPEQREDNSLIEDLNLNPIIIYDQDQTAELIIMKHKNQNNKKGQEI